MRPPKNDWPNTAASRGVLMFAQLMSEMLTPTTFESFRVFSLGTIARVDEAIELILDVDRNRIPRAALEPPIAEIIWSLAKDPVVDELLGEHRIALAELVKRQDYNLGELRARLILMQRLLSASYKTALETNIVRTFSDTTKRIELRQCAGFYCSHLINLGYSKPYIAEQVERMFFQTSMRRTGKQSLSRFFKLFDGKEKKFVVYATLDDRFSHFVRDLGFTVMEMSQLPTEVAAALNVSENSGCEHFSLVHKTEAKDDYAAMIVIYDLIGSFRALTYMDLYGLSAVSGPIMFVCRPRSNEGKARQKITFSFERQRPSTTTRPVARSYRNITNYSQRILRTFDVGSFGRMLASINTYALARQSSSSESQLTALWSSIEVLLGQPARDETRIVYYTRLLIPCVCLRYVRRQIIAVCDEMLISYRRKFKHIISQDQYSKKPDQHAKFAAIMFLEENEHLRKELCVLCADNPLALHRLWKLHRDFSSTKSAADALKGHEARVYWQVCRIYRARNRVVHAGDAPSIMDSLVLNAAEYYTTAVAAIVNRANRQTASSDIDQIVAEIDIEYQLYKRYFGTSANKAKLTGLDLERLIP